VCSITLFQIKEVEQMVVEFSIIPLDKGISLSPYVAHAVEVLVASGLNYHVHAMGTVVEGEWDVVFGIIKRCHERMRTESARVITNISVDDRQGATNRLEGKRKSVEEILGHTVR
jgi:uncharacterized protein (TIGR00106 family)